MICTTQCKLLYTKCCLGCCIHEFSLSRDALSLILKHPGHQGDFIIVVVLDDSLIFQHSHQILTFLQQQGSPNKVLKLFQQVCFCSLSLELVVSLPSNLPGDCSHSNRYCSSLTNCIQDSFSTAYIPLFRHYLLDRLSQW